MNKEEAEAFEKLYKASAEDSARQEELTIKQRSFRTDIVKHFSTLITGTLVFISAVSGKISIPSLSATLLILSLTFCSFSLFVTYLESLPSKTRVPEWVALVLFTTGVSLFVWGLSGVSGAFLFFRGGKH